MAELQRLNHLKSPSSRPRLSYSKLEEYWYYPQRDAEDDRLRIDNLLLIEKVIKLISDREDIIPNVQECLN
jgi:hypothetical protein